MTRGARRRAGAPGDLALVLFIVIGIGGGWLLNLIKLVAGGFGPFTALDLLRAIGVYMFPLGAVLGWFV